MGAPPRPTRQDPLINAMVARALYPEVHKWLQDPAESEEYLLEAIEDTLRSTFNWSGYALTRELEGDGWDVDDDLVEIFSRAEMEKHWAHQALVKAWVEAYDVKPDLKVGDSVTVSGLDPKTRMRRPVPGEITKIDLDLACYHVFIPSFGHKRPGTKGSGTLAAIYEYEEVRKVPYPWYEALPEVLPGMKRVV